MSWTSLETITDTLLELMEACMNDIKKTLERKMEESNEMKVESLPNKVDT